jgi:branched-chain amino acid transport system permease protein
VLTFIVLGLFAGSIYALASLGIVLTYKTTGVFNFAYGGIAMFCAYAFWQLRDGWGLSQWLSIPLLLLVVAPLLGLMLEALFRLLSQQTAEVQIVVCLGVLAFFTTVVQLVFVRNPSDSVRNLSTVFSQGSFNLTSDVTVTWNEAGTFILALAMGFGLYAIMRWTPLGTAMRAVVDNRDLAGLIAVNARTIGRAAWIISTVFAAVAGVLLSTQENLVTYVLPFLVIFSFGPAVLGRLTNLGLAFLGSIILGLTLNILAKYSSSGFLAKFETSLPYLVLFVLLVVYGKRLTEVKSSLRVASSRAVANPFRGYAVGVVALVVAMVVCPTAFGASTVSAIAQAMAYAIVAITVVILTGWTGQISIAQMSFAGVGAFTAAHIAGTHAGMFPVALVVGVLIAVPVSLLVGIPSLRLSGLFLALATMAFALLMDNMVFSANSISGGLTGLTLTDVKIGPVEFASPTSQFYLCAVMLGVTGLFALWLRHGPVGRRLQMVRDSPNAASTLGASLTVTKLAVFAGCAGLASVSGSLLAMTQETVVPSNFAFDTSLQLLLVVVIGGRTLISGAVVAGGFYLVRLLPVPAAVNKYLPLGIALSVIAIAQEPDGVVRVTLNQFRSSAAVLYRRTRPPPPMPQTLSQGLPQAVGPHV